MLRVVRRGDRHDARDLTVSIRFEGEFATAFLEGRPADHSRRNPQVPVHRIVREHAGGELEDDRPRPVPPRAHHPSSGLARPRRDRGAALSRMDVGGKPQGQTFVLGGPEQRTVTITSNGPQTAVVAGIDNLALMRTAGFPAVPVRGRTMG